MKGYVDNSTSTANIGIKGYVDNQSFYSNAKVATYLQYGSPSNISVAGNVTAGWFVGNGALLTGVATYSNIQVASYLPTYAGNIANIRLGVSGILTFADGTTQTTAATGGGSSYSNVNVTAYLNATGYNLYSNVNVAAYLAGNISTGNITATGFIGNGAGLTNVTFSQAGNIVGTQSNVTLQAGTFTSVFNNQGNVTMPNVYVSGNVTTGGYFLGNGALLTGITAGSSYSNVNVASYLPTYSGNISANITNGSRYWTFGTDSKLTLPDRTTYISSGTLHNDGAVEMNSPAQVALHFNSGNVQANTALASEVWIYGTQDGAGIDIYNNAGVKSWSFTPTGKLTFAGTLTNGATFDGNDFTAAPNSFIEFAGYTGNTYVGLDNDSVFIQTNWNTAGKQWTFANTGSLIFPDNTVQTTAYTGGSSYSNVQVATYLPTYAGTVSASLVNSSGNILSTGLSVFGNTRIGLAGAVSGQFHSVVGNITQTSSGGAVYINTTGNVLAAAVVAGAVTSTGTVTGVGVTSTGVVAVNSSSGVTTNQTTFPLVNTTATTINFGGAATTLNMGAATVAVSVGSGAGNITAGNITATSLATTGTGGNISGVGAIVSSGNLTLQAGTVTVGGNLTITGTNNNVPVKSGGFVAQNTAVSMDSITAQWLNTGGASANQLALAALTGNVTMLYTYTFQDGTGGSTTGGSASTTLANLSFGWTSIGNPSGVAGDMYNVLVTLPGTNAYRITAMTGSGYSNNFLTVERLV
jgi:hypothetical protein